VQKVLFFYLTALGGGGKARKKRSGDFPEGRKNKRPQKGSGPYFVTEERRKKKQSTRGGGRKSPDICQEKNPKSGGGKGPVQYLSSFFGEGSFRGGEKGGPFTKK